MSELKGGRKSSPANCEDSEHFSVEERTRDWLLEQRMRNVCRYCREGRKVGNIARASFIHTQVICEEGKEEDSVKYITKAETCHLLMKKCSCGQCEDKITENIT